jgi:uncharacterized membrane protein YccC
MRFARRLRRVIVTALFALVVFVMGALATRQPGSRKFATIIPCA